MVAARASIVHMRDRLYRWYAKGRSARSPPEHAYHAARRSVMDNARPEAGEVYAAMDMPWAKLVGQIAHAYGK